MLGYHTPPMLPNRENEDLNRAFFFTFCDEPKMLRHCVPIFILPTGNPFVTDIYANGTAGLIDTGTRKLLVTCEHIWAEFLRFRKDNPTARLAVVCKEGPGFPVLIDDKSLIDCDSELDLAVFDANPFIDQLGPKAHFSVYQFPVVDPKAKDPISFIGFPGQFRHSAEGVARFRYSSFWLSVADVSDTRIILTNADRRHMYDNDRNLVLPHDLGGMSGAPVFTRTSSWGFKLAGFVRAGNSSDRSIFLSKASFLRRDGSLFRPNWHRHPTP